jgi:DHA1 family bicyclomycin/chloramphenicol resistance-like MFS transporter
VREYPKLLTSQQFWGYCLAAAFTQCILLPTTLAARRHLSAQRCSQCVYRTWPLFRRTRNRLPDERGLSGGYSVRVGVNRMVLIGALLTVAGMLTVAGDLAGFQPSVLFLWVYDVGAETVSFAQRQCRDVVCAPTPCRICGRGGLAVRS